MELPRTLTFLNYAVNGAGLGHVTRLAAINRWLRRYAIFAGVKTQHWFLTTSEADSWLFAEGFAAFKLPSKSIVETAGIPKLSYLALAKQWVWNTVALLRPDLFIADTFPNGCFDELAPVLDLCRNKALVLRPVKEEIATRPAFRAAAQLYDRVVVPGSLPESLVPRARQVGPIMLTERFEALPRDQARARLGVSGDAFALLVTGGGGGDEGVAHLFDAIASAVGADPDVHLIFAAGPLYRGPVRRGPRITWWSEPHLAEAMPGLDAAVAAGGYNSVHELAFFGVPALLLPQEKVADDQAARVKSFVDGGAALSLADGRLDAARLAAALGILRDAAVRTRLARGGRTMVPENAARKAAVHLLTLTLPQSVVRQAEEQLDDCLLAELKGADAPVEQLVDLAVALHGRGRAALDRASLELDAAAGLARAARVCGAPLSEATALASALARASTSSSLPEEWVDDAEALLVHPAALGQWTALASLVAASTSDRARTPADVARAWVRLLDAEAAAGRGIPSLLRERLVGRPGEENEA